MSNIFQDIGPKLFERGLSVIPIKPGEKRPDIMGWQNFCEEIATEDHFNELLNKYSEHGIGLCLGPASGLIGIDFDYDGPHAARFESLFRKIFQYNSPVEKRGKKNKFTLFYRFNPDIKNEHIESSFRRDTGSLIRFVDILSAGTQTVLPPTIHPDTKEPYFYTLGSLQSVDIDLFPEITTQEIDAIKTIASMTQEDLFEVATNKKSNRHDDIVVYAFKIIDQCKSFDDFVKNIISFDKEKHPTNPYFSDKKYRKNLTPEVHAKQKSTAIYNWLKKKRQSKGIEWDFGKKKPQGSKLRADYDSFNLFFKESIKAKKDILTKQCFHKIDGDYKNILNYIPNLRSRAQEHGLAKDSTADHLYRYVEEMKPELLINIPTWDGVDRISQITNFISVKNVSNEVFTDLFKEWCANIFRRLENPMNQNKIIIFKGDQGKGKDYLIQQLMGGFDHYFANMTVQSRENENFMIMSKNLVLNISEFDQTSRIHISILKDIITKDSAELRLPYAHASENMEFRCSFISSCNFDRILTDPSGNRRFMIFEIEDINWEYPKQQQEQLIAQYHALYLQGYRAQKESIVIMNEYIKGQTPDSLDLTVLALYNERFESILSAGHSSLPGRALKSATIMPVVSDICKITGMKVNTILHLLKQKGLAKRGMDGVHYYGLEHIR